MFEPITDDVWHDTEELRLPGGVIFHARCTLIRLDDGTLWMHSPIPLDDERVAMIERLGTVAHIVAPSGFHHLFATKAKARWPTATLWASPALEGKVDADRWLDASAAAPWTQIEVFEIAGAPKIREHVFLHRPSRTLIVTDLVFHIRYETNWMTRLVLRMAGVHGGRLAQSRLWRTSVKDREACRASVETLLEQDFDRLVVAHGDGVEQDARARLGDALWWMRGQKRR